MCQCTLIVVERVVDVVFLGHLAHVVKDVIDVVFLVHLAHVVEVVVDVVFLVHLAHVVEVIVDVVFLVHLAHVVEVVVDVVLRELSMIASVEPRYSSHKARYIYVEVVGVGKLQLEHFS
jgi:hypothetical protein